MTKPFLWLHIKRCGGTSLRNALGDAYPQVDRRSGPTPFIALPKAYWNDNLNHFRVPLGAYDFRRMLFARKYLYGEAEFSEQFKFIIARNPYARAVSAWRYLTRRWKFSHPRQMLSHYRFEHFLERLPEFWSRVAVNRHVGTHTAPVWPDVVDDDGVVLVDFVGRLEHFEEDYQTICDRIGIAPVQLPRKNATGTTDYRKFYNTRSRRLVERFYWDDINELGYDF